MTMVMELIMAWGVSRVISAVVVMVTMIPTISAAAVTMTMELIMAWDKNRATDAVAARAMANPATKAIVVAAANASSRADNELRAACPARTGGFACPSV